jgi:murein DD-endopeptidase MepM/ murein hydrolase activator NlpD
MRRRHATSVVFAATCGFLAGMVTMAAILAMFQASTVSSNPRVAPAVPPASDEDVTVQPTSADEPLPAVAPAPDLPLEPAPDLDEAIAVLKARHLDVPLLGIDRTDLRSSFDEMRGGARRHEAMDLLAPRNTPVTAVETGVIARLFDSRAGGITVYQFDSTTTFAYYYAHLERYADGLEEGDAVARGQVLGYVGTSGNAPRDTPHLHFAIFLLTEDKRWWEGTPIDPFLVLR